MIALHMRSIVLMTTVAAGTIWQGCKRENASASRTTSTEVTAPAAVVSILAEFCPTLANEPLASVYARSPVLQQIAGDLSGVVVDGGSRVLKQLTVDDCGSGRGRVTLRFTEDAGGGLAGSELFVKEEATQSIVGLAVAADGTELQAVPEELAFDKSNNKTSKDDRIVRTRSGCFECHSQVSHEYGMPGAAAFWNNAKLVSVFQPLFAGEPEFFDPSTIADPLP